MESGFLLVNKPTDWTSHDVVAYLRRVTGVKKIGHAGTLDPFAIGLLIVAVGREATKRIDEFKALPKTYVAGIRLGATSDTYDVTGTISKQKTVNSKQITKKKLEQTLKTFLGKQKQTPPMYSAKKVGGKKLYDLARKGIEIERKACDIEIFDIELIDISPPAKGELEGVHLKVSVSTGTYIRTLAHDIGQQLGTGAYCETLKRTMIGEYSIENAIGPKEFEKETWQSSLFDLT